MSLLDSAGSGWTRIRVGALLLRFCHCGADGWQLIRLISLLWSVKICGLMVDPWGVPHNLLPVWSLKKTLSQMSSSLWIHPVWKKQNRLGMVEGGKPHVYSSCLQVVRVIFTVCPDKGLVTGAQVRTGSTALSGQSETTFTMLFKVMNQPLAQFNAHLKIGIKPLWL